MKRFLILILFIYATTSTLIAQYKYYHINGTIKDMINKRVVLTSIYGHNQNFIDSTVVDNNGSFSFQLTNKNISTGMLRLMIGKDNKAQTYPGQEVYIDLLFNKEDIDFKTNFKKPVDSMQIISSKENKIYYEFLHKDNKVNQQLEVLVQLSSIFPPEDDFFNDIKNKYNRLQKGHIEYIRNLIKLYPDLFATHIIKSREYPFLEYNLSPKDKMIFVKTHYLDNLDFNDTLLLHTDLFSSKIISYIQLYVNQQTSTQDAQDNEFIKAIDTILSKAVINTKVLKYVCDYLKAGFERLNKENIVQHILTFYEKQVTCDNNNNNNTDELDNIYKKRLEGYKKIAIGNIAPNIDTTDYKGNKVNISKLKNNKIMILFWASWCPHCMETLPEIHKFYEKLKKNKPNELEIIAISLDTNKTDFNNTILRQKFTWINICDFKGWMSKFAEAYYIHSTPTMIILDKNRKILLKPNNIDDLQKFFN
jgi:thiol-disulfide isomerase/thioredoxin